MEGASDLSADALGGSGDKRDFLAEINGDRHGEKRSRAWHSEPMPRTKINARSAHPTL
jgi:hypothetical protein